MTGEVIADRFELGRKVGEGGMGTVFTATDGVSGETVALKILRTGTEAPDVSEVARFEREASLLAQLEHPGIVRYVAHGSSGGKIWLAMEWLEGETLDERLERQGLTLTESVDVIRQVAEALEAAHERGVVHRDLKPANLFLVGKDPAALRVLDFGVARALGGTALTSTGVAIGTPQYMSPE
ncbi:MAG: serine/threonine protein kinase, partial [Actinobacteria bacterium]|nr:serine/threonine protein kinase [Actinomycetota bacterium]NIS36409.1 serine/threonine protein kinase [Actinomycetota bacterium]NIW32863.1 protein kinase [Actinomycetota bacterium]